jgi:5-methylcytosine-specific restriction endonuclease McrA
MSTIHHAEDVRCVGRVMRAIRTAQAQKGRIVLDAYGADTRCVYCRGAYESDDHVTPIAAGGHTRLDNMVPSCKKCNELKRDLLLADFFADHPRLAWNFSRWATHVRPAYRAVAAEYGADDL